MMTESAGKIRNRGRVMGQQWEETEAITLKLAVGGCVKITGATCI